MKLSKAAAQLLRWSQSGGNNINDLGLSVPALIRAADELKKAGLSSEIMGSDDGIEGVVLTAASNGLQSVSHYWRGHTWPRHFLM